MDWDRAHDWLIVSYVVRRPELDTHPCLNLSRHAANSRDYLVYKVLVASQSSRTVSLAKKCTGIE